MTKRIMVPEYRLQLIEDAVSRLTEELKRLRSESICVERKPFDESDEAKRARERARVCMQKSRAKKRAARV